MADSNTAVLGLLGLLGPAVIDGAVGGSALSRTDGCNAGHNREGADDEGPRQHRDRLAGEEKGHEPDRDAHEHHRTEGRELDPVERQPMGEGRKR
jgi:hypothetical protein